MSLTINNAETKTSTSLHQLGCFEVTDIRGAIAIGKFHRYRGMLKADFHWNRLAASGCREAHGSAPECSRV